MQFLKFFKKKDQENIASASDDVHNKVSVDPNTWYQNRYDNIIIQRNVLLLLTFFCVIVIGVGVVSIYKLSELKQFDPYVIQIDEDTGYTKLVTKFNPSSLNANEEVIKYFLKKYVISRETYNSVDFDTTARRTVRLMSSGEIYSRYMGYIRNKKNDPTITYGNRNSTFLTVKSWSKLDAKKYMIRFSVTETAEGMNSMDKIAVVEFDYFEINLSEEDKDINPIGILITGYRVDEDRS